MAYCTVADVEAIEAQRLQHRHYADDSDPVPNPPDGTIPSLTMVTNFIGQIYDEINETILRAGYKIPLTVNNYLIQANAMGAAYLIEVVLGVAGSQETINATKPRQDAYLRMLDNISKNPRLVGAIPARGTNNNLVTSDGVANYTNPNAPYQINERQW